MDTARHTVSANALRLSDVAQAASWGKSHALERHLPDLRRRARALLHRSSDAEDLTQDCMLRALPHLDDIDDLRAYLFQTLRNAYADRISVLSREADAVTLEDADSQLVDRRSPQLRLEVRDVARQVAKLPREQRQVLLLVAAGGATYDEAAMQLNIPVGTVMSRLSRARKTLRDQFASGDTAA
jgi:RNA polymerase sigma-70 factor (ECF subfamily)